MDPQKQLRDLNDPARWDLPPGQDARLAVNGAVARPRRHGVAPWLAAAATVAVVAAVGGVGLLVNQHSGADTPNGTAHGVIVWKALAAAPSADLSEPPAPCAATDLSVGAVGAGGPAMGSFQLLLAVTSSSEKSCTLNLKGASLEGELPDGTTTLGTIKTEGVAELGPGQSYRLRTVFPESCAASDGASAQGATPLTFRVHGVGVAVRDAEVPPAVAICGTTAFMGEAPVSAQDDGTGPYSHLDVELAVPDSVSSPVLDYTLLITNKDTKPFTFDQCPSYTESGSIFAEDGTGPTSQAHESYALNCFDAGPITPGETVKFAMKFDVPSGHGLLKLGWFWQDDGPSTNAVIEHVDVP